MWWAQTPGNTYPLKLVRDEDKESGFVMGNKDCSCWKIVDCETSKDCPDKCGSGQTCWETAFFHNNWQKVFEKCRHCKVFKQKLIKYKQA
jgi:hypothetical protein